MTGKIKTYDITRGSRVVSVRWEDLRPSLHFNTITKVNTSSIYIDDFKLSRRCFEELGFEKEVKTAIYYAYGYLLNSRSSELRRYLVGSVGGVVLDDAIAGLYESDLSDASPGDVFKYAHSRRLRLVAIARLQRLEAELLKRKILKATF